MVLDMDLVMVLAAILVMFFCNCCCVILFYCLFIHYDTDTQDNWTGPTCPTQSNPGPSMNHPWGPSLDMKLGPKPIPNKIARRVVEPTSGLETKAHLEGYLYPQLGI